MIGAHASISPSILHGIKYIQSLGGSAVQIFAGSNQSSSLKAKQQVSEEQTIEIKKYLQENKIYLAIHAIYLLNFCSNPPSSARIAYAHSNLKYDLELAEKIGASTVVLHIGYQTNLTEEEAYNNMADNVIHSLRETQSTAPNVSISLETPAGKGSQIATTIPEFEKLFKLIQDKLKELVKNKTISSTIAKLLDKRITICVDTAHIYSSGQDIRDPDKFKSYFKSIHSKFGKRIALIHLNDSKQPFNSRKDQHEGLGDGTIFNTPKTKLSLKYLVQWCEKHSIPLILETHKAGSPKNPLSSLYAQEIALLQNLSSSSKETPLLNLAKWKLDHSTTHHNLATTEKLNEQILKRLYQLKEYYAKVEKDTIRSRAYNKAYLILLNYPEEISSGNQVSHLVGIGKQTVKKIDEYLNNGEMEIIKQNPKIMLPVEKQLIPQINILGFGEKKLKELKTKKLTTISQVRKAFSTGKINLNKKELMGVEYYEDLNKKMTRAQSISLYNYINKIVEKSGILKELKASMEIAGSFPSGKKESKDLDILIFTAKYSLPVSSIPIKYINQIAELFNNDKNQIQIYQKGNTKLLCIIKHNNIFRHVDIRLLPKESEITGRHYFTSGRDFNVMMRQLAISKGYLLNEYGLYDRKDLSKPIKLSSEEDLFAKLDISFIPLMNRRNKLLY